MAIWIIIFTLLFKNNGLMKSLLRWIWLFPITLIFGLLISRSIGIAFGLNGFLLTLIGSLVIRLIIYQLTLYRKERIKKSVELSMLSSSEELLYKVDSSSKAETFIFMLRPFGNDGSMNRYSDVNRFINIPIEENSVEKKICEEIEVEFGIRVVALADQNVSKVPRYPSYYKCNHEQWKLHAELLFKKCLFTVIHIPFSTSIRKSLKWEIFTAMCSGLRSRILVLYPDHWVDSENTIVSDLKSQLSFIYGVSDLSNRSIGFILKDGIVCKQYILELPKKGIATILPRDYKNVTANLGQFLKDMLSEMKANVYRIPKQNLNAFQNATILDYSFDLTEQQMQLIYESKEGHFDVLGL
jgi:hypothetical protein